MEGVALGVIALAVALYIDRENYALPAGVLLFLIMDHLGFGILVSVSIALNTFLSLLFIVRKNGDKNDESEDDSYTKVIKKNKRHFPFHQNIKVAVAKHPYTYLYLKEGKTVRLRCSLKELLDIPMLNYLERNNRNTAISSDVKNTGDSFVVEGNTVTSGMILNWGKNSD